MNNFLSSLACTFFAGVKNAACQQYLVFSSELRSLTELPDGSIQLNPATSAAIQLGYWWNCLIERNWTLVPEMAAGSESDPLLALCASQPAAAQKIDQRIELSAEVPPDDGLICRKTLSLSKTGSTFSLSLMMEQLTQPNQHIRVVARLSPNLGQAYLPADVQLEAADESLVPFSVMRSRTQSPFIALKFRANAGDYFRLTVAFEGVTVAEDFIV